MDETSQRTALRSLLIHIAAFSFAAGFYISTKKFLDFAPTEPSATGHVTVVGASKLQDYVRFGYFLFIVPLLTLVLGRLLPRIGKRITGGDRTEDVPLFVVALATIPLVLSPFLYLTTYKELWSVLFPPLLSALVLIGWTLVRRHEWLRALGGASTRGAAALVMTEGVAVVLFRYLFTGERIAHMPSLLLESIFVVLFLTLWWGGLAGLARFGQKRTGRSIERCFDAIAWGATPLILLPIVVLLPVAPSIPAFTCAALAIVGVITFGGWLTPPAPDFLIRFAAWIAAPLAIFALSYASSAHTTGWVDLFHQGEMLGPASDYLRGKTPYIDILPLHGLLQDGLLDAWLMEMFGRSSEIAIQRATILESLMLPTIWMLGWVLFRSSPAALAAVIATIILSADNQRAVPEIVVVMLMLVGLRSGRAVPMLFAGIVSSVALFLSVDIGVYCIIGGLSSLALLWLIDRATPARTFVVSGGAFLLGVLVGVAPFLVYFQMRGVTAEFFHLTFVAIPGLIDATWSLPFPDLDDWFSKSFSSETLFNLAWHLRFVINALILAIAVIVVARRALQRSMTIDDRFLALLTVFGILTQRSALGRADFYHQWFAAFLVAPILIALILRSASVIREKGPAIRTAAVIGTILLIPVSLVVFWAPLLLEQRLDDTTGFRARRAGNAPDPQGEMSSRRIERVVTEIQRLSSKTDSIFDFSNQPALYFFADRRNPTRFYQVPLLSPREFQEEAVESLRRDPPAVVVMSAPDRFDRFDQVINRDRAPLVASWIEHHYRPAIQVEGIDLWTRAPDVAPWQPPATIPGPRDVALRPHDDGRVVFPSVGSLVGADMARWTTDLYLYNPEDVAVEYRLRFVTVDAIHERRHAVDAGRTEVIADVAERMFGVPGTIGALWVIYDPVYAPITRVVTRREPGSGRGIHGAPLSESDVAMASDARRSRLIITGYSPKEGERLNLSLVNFGIGSARVEIQVLDGAGEAIGDPMQIGIPEERMDVLVNFLQRLEAPFPLPGSIRIDVIDGEVASQLSIVDSQTGSADVLSAVPIGDDSVF